jgi:hypothetical protein
MFLDAKTPKGLHGIIKIGSGVEIFTNVMLNTIAPHNETTATCLKQ